LLKLCASDLPDWLAKPAFMSYNDAEANGPRVNAGAPNDTSPQRELVKLGLSGGDLLLNSPFDAI
jgi:hypothetical protein